MSDGRDTGEIALTQHEDLDAALEVAVQPEAAGIAGFGRPGMRRGEVMRLVAVCGGKVMSTIPLPSESVTDSDLLQKLAAGAVGGIGARWLPALSADASSFSLFAVSYAPDVWRRWDDHISNPRSRIPPGLLPRVPGERAVRREDLDPQFRAAVVSQVALRLRS